MPRARLGAIRDVRFVQRTFEVAARKIRPAEAVVAFPSLNVVVGREEWRERHPSELATVPFEQCLRTIACRDLHEVHGGYPARPLLLGSHRKYEVGVACRAQHAERRLGHALVDIRRLLMYGRQHRAGIGVEAKFGVGIAHTPHHIPNDRLKIDGGRGSDFASDQDQACRDERFASHAPLGILRQNGVEHAIGYLIGDLVWMSFRH